MGAIQRLAAEAKARLYFQLLAARLKSRPDTSCGPGYVFPQPVVAPEWKALQESVAQEIVQAKAHSNVSC